MPFLIDGHNLIPNIPGLSLEAYDDETRLIALLRTFCHRRRTQVEVFFDNAPAGYSGWQQHGPVNAYFSPKGRPADIAIRDRLASLGREASNWTVVSTDREVQAMARGAGARSLPATDFAAMLLASHSDGETEAGVEPTVSQEEVDDWLRLFEEKGEGQEGI